MNKLNANIHKLQFFLGNLILMNFYTKKDKNHNKCFSANDKKRKVYSWGNGLYGQLGISEEKTSLTIPQEVLFPEQINPHKLFASFDSSACLSSDGRLFVWGKSSEGSIGKQNIVGIMNFNSPIILPYQENIKGKVINTSFSKEHGGAVDDLGNIYTWGVNNFGKLGFVEKESEESRIKKPKNLFDKIQFNQIQGELKDKKIVQISCGFNHTVRLIIFIRFISFV